MTEESKAVEDGGILISKNRCYRFHTDPARRHLKMDFGNGVSPNSGSNHSTFYVPYMLIPSPGHGFILHTLKVYRHLHPFLRSGPLNSALWPGPP